MDRSATNLLENLPRSRRSKRSPGSAVSRPTPPGNPPGCPMEPSPQTRFRASRTGSLQGGAQKALIWKPVTTNRLQKRRRRRRKKPNLLARRPAAPLTPALLKALDHEAQDVWPDSEFWASGIFKDPQGSPQPDPEDPATWPPLAVPLRGKTTTLPHTADMRSPRLHVGESSGHRNQCHCHVCSETTLNKHLVLDLIDTVAQRLASKQGSLKALTTLLRDRGRLI